MGLFTKRYHPPGTTPGTLTAVTRTSEQRPLRISLLDYDEDRITELPDASLADCISHTSDSKASWIHVQGTPEPELLHALGEAFGLHGLALEDVLNSGQRPKAEVYDGQFFVIMGRPVWRDGELSMEQVSLFLLERLVISFHQGEGDPFEPIRRRLRGASNGGFNQRTADYLYYALIDVVIDEGFPLLEILGERIEDLEDELLENPGQGTLNDIHRLKRELLLLRRMLWPHREVLNVLLREEDRLIQPGIKLYLRDCYDHTIHIMELLEAYRDMAASMLDVYLSSVSNRLNENMRILTVIATTFMPLTFIAGLYGMNFDRASPWNMPELGWRYGYPAVVTVMVVVMIGMVGYFRRKDWL
ncbi:magnesium/cobalt transporter CorA [Methylogaea oryzae]|uniref:Magnesium transport protein CorA n=1 Tax=Methylogaea oryzae TaxID=1295382 RepID=A0A8D4VVA1_9GAMM|nr:magnesium/cobalt transporter CorA [Methylogaea oryzae]BBL72895.1 magnesium transport protein CorA [Methylogaea oryzae]